MKIAAFPAQAAFLPALAKHWLETHGPGGEGLLILPSRRAAQALAGAFLAANHGRALLLPRIIAIGAMDEAGLTLAGALDLPPAVAPLRRQALLTRLILRMNGRDGAPKRLHAAWALAADLASLLDEADYAEIDLAAALPNLVAADFATHWQTTLEFLSILTITWPAILADIGCMNPAARQMGLIDAQNAAWRVTPPDYPVWLATSGGNPALSRLARTVGGLPNGLLLLPGYDREIPDTSWEQCGDSHPQGGIARLLGAIGARREEIAELPAPPSAVPAGRSLILSRALLPAESLGAWQHPADLNTTGLFRLSAQDEAQNATAIAMILRDAMELPGRTAALITPDRGLAVRVAAALKRFGITADDSAGEPIEQTPPAVYLRLLARAAVAQDAPLPFIALLKHPLTAAGLPPEICRENARQLEKKALRGPRPSPGLDGIKFRLEKQGRESERVFLERLELILRDLALPEQINPAAALRALLAAGENLAATESEPGAARLWAGEAGIALSERLLEALSALEDLPDMPGAELADLLDALLTGAVLRRPRAKDGHPRIAIWGVREAALQSVDVAVLGGLVEGVWPEAAEPGPWLSRPMRKAAGLPSPEQKIGQAAHDFFALACACETIVLSAPARRERAPAVPARWLTRLDALLQGAKQSLPDHNAAAWALQLDLPASREKRPRPRPRPPEAARPRELSISDVATLIADPYAIYVRKVLNIDRLDALDEESDPAMFGEIVHAGLAAYFANPAAGNLNHALQTAMRTLRPRAALENWWSARLERIAAWITETETARQAEFGAPLALKVEISGSLDLPGGFKLKARADRIERNAYGIAIIDYKTGSVPSAEKVESGTAPQLPLEAVMAQAGAFGPEFQGQVTELAYIKLSGRAEAGEERSLFAKKPDALHTVIENAEAALPALFAKFAQAQTPYLAAPHPGRPNEYDVYAGISRRAEWAGEEE